MSEKSMFKYCIGQTLRIKAGIHENQIFIVEEDGLEMSSGKYSIPRYFFARYGCWYYEDEVELIKI